MKIILQSDQFPQSVYYKYGHGFPIILLHGFAEDHRIWEEQIAELQKHFLIIVPDIPGSGDSPLPIGKMSMELIAEFVYQVTQQEQITSTILFGHSMGGYASLAFAEKYNDLLVGLGLIHSSAYEDSEEKKETRTKAIKLIEQDGRVAFTKALIPNLYGEKSKKSISNKIELHLTRALEISSESLIAYYNAMKNRPDRSFILKEAEYPVFLFSGTEDKAVPFSQSLQQSYLAKHSQLEVVQDIGHMGMYEASETLNESIINYCNGILNLKMP